MKKGVVEPQRSARLRGLVPLGLLRVEFAAWQATFLLKKQYLGWFKKKFRVA